jgi:hypothetical protein
MMDGHLSILFTYIYIYKYTYISIPTYIYMVCVCSTLKSSARVGRDTHYYLADIHPVDLVGGKDSLGWHSLVGRCWVDSLGQHLI